MQQPLIRKPLDPFSKLEINRLATNQDFEDICQITQKIGENNDYTTVLIKNLRNSGYSIAKIYDCCNSDPKKLNKKKLNKYWTQYHIVKYGGFMEYFGIFYDEKTYQLIIHQQTLQSFIRKNGPMRKEMDVKVIVNDILLKLWRLHNYNYVHCNIKPSNIMQRRLDDLYVAEFINDGWLLIDFYSMKPSKTKGIYTGTMGWTAPEIDYDSKKNVFRSSSDIFSFGLIILFLMFGFQPFQIPSDICNKYRVNGADNEEAIMKKKKLKDKICGNWHTKYIMKSENMIKNYLVKLYYDNKISLELFELLHDGILIYDYKKRLSCKQIYFSKWLSDINQLQQDKTSSN